MSDDAIRHGIEQTEAPVIFTDQDLMPRLTSVLKGIALIRGETKVRFIVYFENSHEETFERPKVVLLLFCHMFHDFHLLVHYLSNNKS